MNKDGKWLFIGTDQRLASCAQMFEGVHHPSDSHSDELVSLLAELRPRHVVLPVAGMKGNVPAESFEPGTRIYTGVACEGWISECKNAGLTVLSYVKEELFVWENAKLTAEGFLKEFYQAVNRSVEGKHFIVTGFGKVAKMTAKTLQALGGQVTIAARSESQLSEAAALGYGMQPLSDVLPQEGYLVNTIPSRWLELPGSSRLRVFDLASLPGCLKADSPNEYYTIHLGLPGKHFPADASLVLARALQRLNS